jgi:hypothetical protein
MGDPISSMPGISPEGMAARVFNSHDVEDTDGYLGLGLLCAFDLLVTPGELLARYNQAQPLGVAQYAGVLRAGGCA